LRNPKDCALGQPSFVRRKKWKYFEKHSFPSDKIWAVKDTERHKKEERRKNCRPVSLQAGKKAIKLLPFFPIIPPERE